MAGYHENPSIKLVAVKSEQDSKAFQKDLDKLAAWGKTWTMEFHPDKTRSNEKSAQRDANIARWL